MKFDGTRLRDLREAKGYSLEDMAEKIGKTRQTISNWEKGVNDPSIPEIGKLGDVLGVKGRFFIKED